MPVFPHRPKWERRLVDWVSALPVGHTFLIDHAIQALGLGRTKLKARKNRIAKIFRSLGVIERKQNFGSPRDVTRRVATPTWVIPEIWPVSVEPGTAVGAAVWGGPLSEESPTENEDYTSAFMTKSSFEHPLTEFVLSRFTKDPAHDRVTLAEALGSPSRPRRAPEAYKIVAEDVLNVMLLNGYLVRDSLGWYRLCPE
jgi:hypothetical protein